jgi:uncharacterized protein
MHACTYRFGGSVGRALTRITDNWLLSAPDANPAMLEMFADRDVPPYRDMVPWAGEFAGKYLTSAVEVWRATGDARLEICLREFVRRLISLQDADGYLGPWPIDARLTNFSRHHGSAGLETWDTWGHYHIMVGLLGWYEATGDRAALESALRIGDLICRTYLGDRTPRLVDTPWTEMNLAPVHSLAMLYRRTGVERYLALAEQIVREFAATRDGKPLAGDYLEASLAGREFYEMPRPRWESLHAVMGLAELHHITSDARYRAAFERMWHSIADHDRHNNGGFSSGEQATGNPFDPRPIETCCNIAWLSLSVEMLKLTGDPRAADELELTTLNSALGLLAHSGRWATYNTPSDGVRVASAHHIVFQARPGSPELNCCSVNAPRGLGLLSEWALVSGPAMLTLNYYGPCEMIARLPDGSQVTLSQETDYPLAGRVRLAVSPSQPAQFTLRLRIPAWSRETRVSVNGEPAESVAPGMYLAISRLWRAGDTVTLDLDMALRFWHGEREAAGHVSIYRGPLLLACDQRYNRDLPAAEGSRPYGGEPWQPAAATAFAIPPLDVGALTAEPVAWDGWLPPNLLLCATGAGRALYLCDYASAGQAGTLYRSWLPVE